jgi:transketolase
MESSYRKTVIDLLVPYFEQDDRLYLLIGDMGFGTCDLVQARFPHRITNCGVMEQAMVGISAGMAIGGMVPIVYSMPNFLCIRALEQIRNDILFQNLNVKLLGTGAGQTFEHLGKSHCGGEMDVNLMNLVGMPVFDPYGSPDRFDILLNQWITSETAGYLRV